MGEQAIGVFTYYRYDKKQKICIRRLGKQSKIKQNKTIKCQKSNMLPLLSLILNIINMIKWGGIPAHRRSDDPA